MSLSSVNIHVQMGFDSLCKSLVFMSYMYVFDSGSNYVFVLMYAGLLKKRVSECLAMLDALM